VHCCCRVVWGGGDQTPPPTLPYSLPTRSDSVLQPLPLLPRCLVIYMHLWPSSDTLGFTSHDVQNILLPSFSVRFPYLLVCLQNCHQQSDRRGGLVLVRLQRPPPVFPRATRRPVKTPGVPAGGGGGAPPAPRHVTVRHVRPARSKRGETTRLRA
jgi:hypothetical protein